MLTLTVPVDCDRAGLAVVVTSRSGMTMDNVKRAPIRVRLPTIDIYESGYLLIFSSRIPFV